MTGAPTHRVLEVAAAGGSRRYLRGARPQDRLRGLQLVRATRPSGGHAGLVGAPPPTEAELAAACRLPVGVLHSGHSCRLLLIELYFDWQAIRCLCAQYDSHSHGRIPLLPCLPHGCTGRSARLY